MVFVTIQYYLFKTASSGFHQSLLELAFVVHGCSFRQGVVQREVAVSVGGRHGCNSERSEVSSVFVNAEVALVVPHDAAEEEDTRSCVHHSRLILCISNQAGVLDVECEWVLFHDDNQNFLYLLY